MAEEHGMLDVVVVSGGPAGRAAEARASPAH
jgi:hypothetical protein